MKHILTSIHQLTLFFTIIFSLSAYSQGIQFEQILPNESNQQFTDDFIGVENSSLDFADVDNDGDEDIIIMGEGNLNNFYCFIYKNNGEGKFSKDTTNQFEGLSEGALAFADVNGDQSPDVLITGLTEAYDYTVKLYINNGQGIFSLSTNHPFEATALGSITFADIDNDDDQDVLITGQNESFDPISTLYTNDGTGNFTEVVGTPFIPIKNSDVAFEDIDGDNDQDVLIMGRNAANNYVTELYTNDGFGNFTQENGATFDQIGLGKLKFADMDNDGDQDVLIFGRNSTARVTQLYLNNGSGEFTEEVGAPFVGLEYGGLALQDIDNDGDQDVICSGKNGSNSRVTKLYLNDGNNTFSEVSGTPFDAVAFGDIGFSDFNGNGFQDILITGMNASNIPVAKLYGNDGQGSYSESTGSVLEGMWYSSCVFADVDNDSDQDIILSGRNNQIDYKTTLYMNDGSGAYTEILGTPFDGGNYCAIAAADIDNDDDVDVLVTGNNSSNDRIAKLYTYEGIGVYNEVANTPFDGVESGALAFSDIDGDGDKDLLITGRNVSNIRIAKLYENAGDGTFTEMQGVSFDGVMSGTANFMDFDNDGDQDLLITGRNSVNQLIAKVYKNDGSGVFVEENGIPFEGVEHGSVSCADIDNNGFLDVFISGLNNSSQPIAKIYLNNGQFNFSEITSTPFQGVQYSSSVFFDVDSDGLKDLLVTGENANGEASTKLYRNTGSANFVEVTDVYLDPVKMGSVAAADIDGDDDEDLLITGSEITNDPLSKLFRNNTCPVSNMETTLTTCGTYTWPVDGNTYDQSGSYTATFTNQAGCDSVHALNLTIDCSFYVNVAVTNNVGANCEGVAEANVYNGVAPYNYEYSNGETANVAENLCTGVYDLTVTDSGIETYTTTFVISDQTVDYTNDPDYDAYLDSLYSSAVSNCDLDYNQPIDSFYVDENDIVLLDSNLIEVTWYIYQNMDTFILTNVYYITEDINGSFAYTLTVYCEDENRDVLKSINFTYKTEGTLSTVKFEKEKLKLYPNPSSGMFTLESELIDKDYQIFDAQGRIIQSGKIENKLTHIKLDKEKVGVYYLKVEDHILKIVKQ